jgi:hypothetical protein
MLHFQEIPRHKQQQLSADIYDVIYFTVTDQHLTVSEIVMLIFRISSTLFHFTSVVYQWRNTGLEQNTKLKDGMCEQEKKGKFSSSFTGLPG